jgi:AraC family transcriptional regulator
MELRYEGVKRHLPPPVGSISVIPAGSPSHWQPKGDRDFLHIYLEPSLVERVAAEVFDLDSARKLPPLDGEDLPHLRAAMLAVNDEMTSEGTGGSLVVESLANLLAVHLIRHVREPREPLRGTDGVLPRARLRAVLEYVEEHLGTSLSLEQLATVARVSAYHFARQFKTATGLPPHQYVITRRVERAKELLQACDRSLAEIAMNVGFSDQSQFCHHFKRLIGITPGQFRKSARNT